MNRLEEELKQALARKEPPVDFAARVRGAVARRPIITVRRWLAAAASLLIMSGGGLAYRHHEGVVAKEQVMLAVRITATKLNRIQARVREVNP